MFLANVATYALSHVPTAAAWIFQEATVGWDPVSLWKQMGILAKIVVSSCSSCRDGRSA